MKKSVDKETLIEYQKFLIKNELMGSNAFYNAERFLSEIEPDNEKAKTELQKLNDFLNKEYNLKESFEKPYLFYEGEKYYFGEEYEFSDDEEEWHKLIFESFNSKYFFGLKHIRKIDHTTKYKKLLLELKQQAENDGVNLKELI